MHHTIANKWGNGCCLAICCSTLKDCGQRLCQELQHYYYYYLKIIPDVRGTLQTKIIDGPCPLKLK